MQEVTKITEKTISGARFQNKEIMDAYKKIRQLTTELETSMERNESNEDDDRIDSCLKAAKDLYDATLPMF